MLLLILLVALAVYIALNFESISAAVSEMLASIASMFTGVLGQSRSGGAGDPAPQTEIEARVVPRKLIPVAELKARLESMGLKSTGINKLERKVYVIATGAKLKERLDTLGLGNLASAELAGRPVAEDLQQLLKDMLDLDTDRGFVRVRTDPTRGPTACTIAVKTYTADSPHATEREITADDYKIAATQMGAIFREKSEHITFRELFDTSAASPPMNDAGEVTIDVVLPIPPYIEIEAPNDQSLQRMVGAVISSLGQECDVYYGAYGGTMAEIFGTDAKTVNDNLAAVGPNSADLFRPLVKKNHELFEEVSTYIKREFGAI